MSAGATKTIAARQIAMLGSLPLIAKAIGNNFGVKVVFHGDSAFNLNAEGQEIICLPETYLQSPESLEALNGFLDHEVGHVRFTIQGQNWDLTNKALKTTFNVLEDVRIEHKMGLIYPGCSRNLRYLSEKYQDRFWPCRQDDTNILRTLLFAVLVNLRYEILGMEGLKDLSEAHKGQAVAMTGDAAWSATWDIAKDVLSDPDSAAVWERARRLLDLVSKIRSQGDQNSEASGDRDSEASGDRDSEASGDRDSEASGDRDSEASGDRDDVQCGIGELLAAIISPGTTQGSQRAAPTHIYRDPEIVPWTWRETAPLPSYASATQGLMRHLDQILVARAETHRWAAYSGRVDHRRLDRVAVGHGRIYERTADQPGQNTDIVVILDVSGSMSDSVPGTDQTLLSEAIKVVLAIGDAVNATTGTTLQVIAFSSGVYTFGTGSWRQQKPRIAGLKPCATTDLAPALLEAAQRLLASAADRQIVLVVTDGRPGDAGLATEIIQDLNAVEIDVFGLYLGSGGLEDLFPTGRLINLATIEDLGKQMALIVGRAA